MNICFGMLPRAVKSPVRASKLSTNWIGLPFFKQIAYRKQLPEALGRK
jgi:hypothetical protein